MLVHDFYQLKQIAVNLYINMRTEFDIGYGRFTVELDQIEPLQLNLYDGTGYRVARLRQEFEDEPPMPSTRRTYIEDETSWASQFLAGLAWILPSIHHEEDDDDVIYDG